jgi:hypothetical protein
MFIVVDEDKKPMSFSDEQFCYCDDERWRDDMWPVQLYTKITALRLIEKSKAFREKNGYDETKYFLMPVNI